MTNKESHGFRRGSVKNRMDVPETYQPVLPGKVQEHIEKKKAQAEQDSLLTQTATAVGKVIGQLFSTHHRLTCMDAKFNVQDLTPDEYREIKTACVNHLSHLVPGIEKETIDE